MDSAPLWRGWYAPQPTRIDHLEHILCAAYHIEPQHLLGSRVGKLSRFRSLLLALAVDVQLVPATSCAQRYGLSHTGVQKAVRRGRSALHTQPALRRELAAVLGPTLGYRIP